MSRAQLAGYIPARPVRQVNVEHEEGRNPAVNAEQCLGNRSAGADVIVASSEVSGDSSREYFVVLDDQYRLVQGCLPGGISQPETTTGGVNSPLTERPKV